MLKYNIELPRPEERSTWDSKRTSDISQLYLTKDEQETSVVSIRYREKSFESSRGFISIRNFIKSERKVDFFILPPERPFHLSFQWRPWISTNILYACVAFIYNEKYMTLLQRPLSHSTVSSWIYLLRPWTVEKKRERERSEKRSWIMHWLAE